MSKPTNEELIERAREPFTAGVLVMADVAQRRLRELADALEAAERRIAALEVEEVRVVCWWCDGEKFSWEYDPTKPDNKGEGHTCDACHGTGTITAKRAKA